MDYPVMAVVVTYNPEIPLLGRDLDALVGQVPHVSVYDNGSANTADIRALVEGYPKVSLVENHENLGLPVSYNRAMAEAVDRGYEWLLTMDQDSVLPEGYIEAASAYFDQSDIAVICPRYWDKNVLTLEQFRDPSLVLAWAEGNKNEARTLVEQMIVDAEENPRKEFSKYAASPDL